MSTQAIRAVLLRYKESCGEDMLLGQRDILNAATVEVEAIERAARGVIQMGMTSADVIVLREIAKDAP